jgi:hypothetical protein
MPRHRDLSGADLHGIHAFVVADAVERAALLVNAADVGKVAFQLSDKTFWILSDYAPATWVQAAGSSGTGIGGIWVGSSAPAQQVTYEQWQATGVGYWGWMKTPASALIVLVAPPAASLELVAYAPTISLVGGSLVSASPPTAALVLTPGVPTILVLSAGVTTVVPPTAALVLAASVPAVSVTGGGGASIFSNPGFESALGGTYSDAIPVGNWYSTLDASGGPAVAGRDSGAAYKIDGVYGARVEADGFPGDEFDGPVWSTALLSQRLNKSGIDASPTVSFKVKTVAGAAVSGPGVGVGVIVRIFDAGDVEITNAVQDKNRIMLWGDVHEAAADLSHVIVPSATPVTVTFDLKAFATAALAAGKTWADVSHIHFRLFSASLGDVVVGCFDTFTAS